MKTKVILTILTVQLLGYLSNAQNPVEPLFQNTNFGDINWAYYKDMDNNYNPYVGSWVYTNGNATFKIVLQKKEMVLTSSGIGQYLKQYSTDRLIGEYQYLENGVEKVNTLQNLTISNLDAREYNLYSTGIVLKNLYPK